MMAAMGDKDSYALWKRIVPKRMVGAETEHTHLRNCAEPLINIALYFATWQGASKRLLNIIQDPPDLLLTSSAECRAYADHLTSRAEKDRDSNNASLLRVLAAQWDTLATEFERLGD